MGASMTTDSTRDFDRWLRARPNRRPGDLLQSAVEHLATAPAAISERIGGALFIMALGRPDELSEDLRREYDAILDEVRKRREYREGPAGYHRVARKIRPKTAARLARRIVELHDRVQDRQRAWRGG